ncbi:MAG: ABC transporter permease [bacterium]|nr:ABC transporter permease [bacterium]
MVTTPLRRWLSLAPAYLWLLIFAFLPFFIMLYFSFLSDVPFGRREPFITLDNYADFFERALYQRLLLNSLLLAGWTTLGCLVLGYPLALALARTVKGRWQAALFLLIIVPFWSSSLIRVYAWVVLLQRDGVISQFFGLFGLQVDSLLFTYPTIIVGLVHSYLPYMVLTIYVAIDRIDRSYMEAAGSLGALPWRAFTKVLFPLSLPGVISGVILVFIPAVGAFVEPRLLGGPAGLTLGTVIEDLFVESFNWTLGASLSFVMLIVVIVILVGSSAAARLQGETT